MRQDGSRVFRSLRSLLLVVAALAMVTSLAGTAFGQLSEGDIEKLQERGQAEGWTFEVKMNPACEYSLDQLCGLKEPDNWQAEAKWNDMSAIKRDIPSSFDWRALDGVTPIRNQGGCGSCWAFGSAGALECNIKIYDDTVVNLSEQWLVSCNTYGYDCGGGWWVHSMFKDRTDQCGDVGAVMEADFPYVQYDAPCNCPYPHEYTIANWGYVGQPWTVPTVEQLKLAIMEYGPVSVAISVNDAFQGYGGGIFNGCENGDINHAVVLVGWDDEQGENGVWFVRNSWGTWWGEAGYMRIPYGCSWVGYNATYVDYKGGLSIAADTTAGWIPFDVNFTGITTLTDIVSWTWDFGDGDSAFVQNPMHTYTEPGMFSVTAEIKTADDTRTKQKPNFIIALADSALAPDTVEATRGQEIVVPIHACNNVPLQQIQIPIEYVGDLGLVFDSFSTAGCRTSYFENQTFYHFDPVHKRVAVLLQCSISGGLNYLEPGSGEILRLYFRVPETAKADQTATIDIDGYGTRLPCFTWPLIEYNPVANVAVVTVGGSGCCIGSAGNVNGDAGDTCDLSDLIYLVNYLFSGGPSPVCMGEANANGDAGCEIDLSDLIYLVNYLFMGGPSPAVCSAACP